MYVVTQSSPLTYIMPKPTHTNKHNSLSPYHNSVHQSGHCSPVRNHRSKQRAHTWSRCMPLDLSHTYMLHIEAIIITFTHVIFLTLICCILKRRLLLSTNVNLWTACRQIFCFNERTLMLMEVRKLKLYGLLLSILALSHGKWRSRTLPEKSSYLTNLLQVFSLILSQFQTLSC